MRNTLFYSKHCPHSVELIQALSNSAVADDLLYVSVDDAHVRTMLYVLKIDSVPTIVWEGQHYKGVKAFELIQPSQQVSNTTKAELTLTLHPANSDDSFHGTALQGAGIGQGPSKRPEMLADGKVSDGDLEGLLARRQADIIAPPTRE